MSSDKDYVQIFKESWNGSLLTDIKLIQYIDPEFILSASESEMNVVLKGITEIIMEHFSLGDYCVPLVHYGTSTRNKSQPDANVIASCLSSQLKKSLQYFIRAAKGRPQPGDEKFKYSLGYNIQTHTLNEIDIFNPTKKVSFINKLIAVLKKF